MLHAILLLVAHSLKLHHCTDEHNFCDTSGDLTTLSHSRWCVGIKFSSNNLIKRCCWAIFFSSCALLVSTELYEDIRHFQSSLSSRSRIRVGGDMNFSMNVLIDSVAVCGIFTASLVAFVVGKLTNLSRKKSNDVMSRWHNNFCWSTWNFIRRMLREAQRSEREREMWSQVILKFPTTGKNKAKKRLSCLVSTWNISTGKWGWKISRWQWILADGGEALRCDVEKSGEESLLVNKLFWQGKSASALIGIGKWDGILGCQLFSDILLFPFLLLATPKTTQHTAFYGTEGKYKKRESFADAFPNLSHSTLNWEKYPKPSKVMLKKNIFPLFSPSFCGLRNGVRSAWMKGLFVFAHSSALLTFLFLKLFCSAETLRNNLFLVVSPFLSHGWFWRRSNIVFPFLQHLLSHSFSFSAWHLSGCDFALSFKY